MAFLSVLRRAPRRRPDATLAAAVPAGLAALVGLAAPVGLAALAALAAVAAPAAAAQPSPVAAAPGPSARPPHRLLISIRDERPSREPGASPQRADGDRPGTFVAGTGGVAGRIDDPLPDRRRNEKTWNTGVAPAPPRDAIEDEPVTIELERPVAIEFRTRAGTSGAAGVRGVTTSRQATLFTLRARLAGPRARIELQPQQPMAPGAAAAAAPTTILEGRIGTWISAAGSTPQRGLWIKVDDAGVAP